MEAIPGIKGIIFLLPKSAIAQAKRTDAILDRLSVSNTFAYFTDNPEQLQKFSGIPIIMYVPKDCDKAVLEFMERHLNDPDVFVIADDNDTIDLHLLAMQERNKRIQILGNANFVCSCIVEAIAMAISEQTADHLAKNVLVLFPYPIVGNFIDCFSSVIKDETGIAPFLVNDPECFIANTDTQVIAILNDDSDCADIDLKLLEKIKAYVVSSKNRRVSFGYDPQSGEIATVAKMMLS